LSCNARAGRAIRGLFLRCGLATWASEAGRHGAASEIGYGGGGWFGCHVRAARRWLRVPIGIGSGKLTWWHALPSHRRGQSKCVPEKQGKANKYRLRSTDDNRIIDGLALMTIAWVIGRLASGLGSSVHRLLLGPPH
jgi:hypothetical protein